MARSSTSIAGAVLVLLLGCDFQDRQPPPATGGPPSATNDIDHHHGDPPHGGLLADWGGGAYHVEFTVDHATQRATVYILGDDARTAVPIQADTLLLSINEPEFQVELKADPQPGDPAGFASQFVGTHENLGIEREFAGTILGEVDGTPYAADFDEAAGGHEH